MYTSYSITHLSNRGDAVDDPFWDLEIITAWMGITEIEFKQDSCYLYISVFHQQKVYLWTCKRYILRTKFLILDPSELIALA